MSQSPIYKVIFHNNGQVYEVFAKAIYQSDMHGFIEIEEFIFGDPNQVIVNPGEEKLRSEFNGVVRSYVPYHAVIRIDEVEKEGIGKIVETKGDNKVMQFPTPNLRPMGISESD